MIFRWPLVRSNQRLIPLDFERLTAAAEDMIAHIAQHVLLDPTDAAYANYGIVLWGLRVTAVNGATATVAPGAALVPNTGDLKKWRLVYLESPYTAEVVPPGAGDRTDMVRLRLDPDVEDTNTIEERQYRRVNPDGAQEVYTESKPSYRRPTAVVDLLANVGNGANPPPGAGYVRLATVKVTSAGAATVVDFRRFMYAPPTGWDNGALEGKYYKGVRSALARLFTTLSAIVTVDGRIKRTVRAEDNGSDINIDTGGVWGLDSVFSVGLRHLMARAVTATAGLVTGQQFRFDGYEAENLAQDLNGLKLGAHMVPCAWVNVDVDPVTGVTRWAGQNVIGVDQFTDINDALTNHFRVRFDLRVDTPRNVGTMTGNPYCVQAWPRQLHGNDFHFPWYDAGRRGAGPIVSCRADAGHDVVVQTAYIYADEGTGIVYLSEKPCSFVVALYGPFPLDNDGYAAANLVSDPANTDGA